MSLLTERCVPFLALAGAALALPGCGSLLESDAPPTRIWWLEPAAPDPSAVSALVDAGRNDLVLDLAVVPGLDTDRILNLDREARLNHYAGAYWPDHLPEVLGSVMARSLEAGGRVRVRQGERAGAGQCLLQLEARSFYGRVNDTATERIEVVFTGELSCGGERRRLDASASEPVSGNRMSVIVAAFQAALDRATAELLNAMDTP